MSDTTTVPGYIAGTWTIDKTHSSVGFSIRHIMISKVKGTFKDFDAEIVTGATPEQSSVKAHATIVSIDTNEPNRDQHLRTNDFFDAENHPTIDFVSTAVRVEADGDAKIDGEFTMRGVTKPVTFDVEFGGFGKDAYGNTKFGATATAVVNREDFGLTYNAALETGGVLLGDKVTITLDIQAVLATPAA